MDMSLVSAILAAQMAKVQMQVGASLLKSNLDSQQAAVQTLLGAGEQSAASLANVAAGIGGNLNITA